MDDRRSHCGCEAVAIGVGILAASAAMTSAGF
jgi:hypothetical protein